MANIQLKDFVTAENDLDGQEYAYISQATKTRKTTLQKIKEFVVGTAALLTADKTVNGAINELKQGIDNNTQSIIDNTSSLSEKANQTDLDTANSNIALKASLASPNFTGTPTIAGNNIVTTNLNFKHLNTVVDPNGNGYVDIQLEQLLGGFVMAQNGNIAVVNDIYVTGIYYDPNTYAVRVNFNISRTGVMQINLIYL